MVTLNLWESSKYSSGILTMLVPSQERRLPPPFSTRQTSSLIPSMFQYRQTQQELALEFEDNNLGERKVIYLFFLCLRYSVEKEMATRPSILAWRIPWTAEPGGLQSMGSQWVGHDWIDLACMHAFLNWKITDKSSLIFGVNLKRKTCLVVQTVKNLPAMRGIRVQSLGWKKPPEEGNGNHFQYSFPGYPNDSGFLSGLYMVCLHRKSSLCQSRQKPFTMISASCFPFKTKRNVYAIKIDWLKKIRVWQKLGFMHSSSNDWGTSGSCKTGQNHCPPTPRTYFEEKKGGGFPSLQQPGPLVSLQGSQGSSLRP